MACVELRSDESRGCFADLIAEVNARGRHLAAALTRLTELDEVGEVRSAGLIAGIELVRDRGTRERFPPELRRAQRVTDEAQRRGLRIRPLLDDILLLAPPFVITDEQITYVVDTVAESILHTRPSAARDS